MKRLLVHLAIFVAGIVVGITIVSMNHDMFFETFKTVTPSLKDAR